MAETQQLFGTIVQGDTVILTPTKDLADCDYQRLRAEIEAVIDYAGNDSFKFLIIDFQHTDYFGSSALGFFFKLWKQTSALGIKMAFCRCTDAEIDILRKANLDGIWPISPTLENAFEDVRS